MSETHRVKHERFVAGYLERNVTSKEERAGVRCGLGDAAHLADAFAADIEAEGRPSKGRAARAALAREIGDAIWQMRRLVPPRPLADEG